MDNVGDYYLEHVKTPWGRMFYDLLFEQLVIPKSPKLKILDFGSGLGITANHFAAWHNVTKKALEYWAFEGKNLVLKSSCKRGCYKTING